MTSYPTKCRACGEKIEKPSGNPNLCWACCDLDSGDPELEARKRAVADGSDLTRLIVRLPKERFIATSAWMAATGKRPQQEREEAREASRRSWRRFWSDFWQEALTNFIFWGSLAIIAYWLGKQAGLWG